MPVTSIRGIDINYEILGDRGPWVALQPGGRRAGASLRPLAAKIAEAGHRVLIYDRRNCGASGIAVDGESENEEWAEDLHELLMKLDALPAYVGGSSSGCRLALILALRRPADVRGLLLWRVTGGEHAAVHLANQYYGSHIEAAKSGGMAAVCAMEHWREVIAANPASRAALMAMDPADFISRMERWRQSFNAGAEHPVIGLSPAELRGMEMPACIVPGKDPVHPLPAGQAAHRLIPNAEYFEVVTEQKTTLDEAFVDWDAKEGLLAATFIDFLRRPARR
jgi:pimeloyl-ACP methyl ester carboxylesterase